MSGVAGFWEPPEYPNSPATPVRPVAATLASQGGLVASERSEEKLQMCPFVREVAGTRFVCTRPPHDHHPDQHNMVSIEECEKYGW